MSVSQQYAVHGMTCDHCVTAVTEEISALSGVIGVEVDLVVNGNSRAVSYTHLTLPTSPKV